ncbi:MAG TPA: efflux RND transporter periplasmic adaptor subunit [Prolixibacteraceae bacterium]|nr:efflux RND transporter periplasmic adaptor subunit [Prolixibacteraceae bacterium]
MKRRFIYIGSAVIILVAGFLVYKSLSKPKQTVSVETAKVEKGSISNTVTATGTLEAVKTITVGTQVSGVIDKIFVDYNSVVKKGQLLAQLDETPLLAQLEQTKASVDQAEAQVKYQKATYERYKALLAKKLIAQADYDQVEFNYQNAVGALKNAQSNYDKNKINLSYARIYSPIDGVVLDRAVEVGQTVAASFNTPTLFTIANDLTQMKVEAKVDEADIGQLKLDQRVEFTVDAFPAKKFSGSVTEIRLQPTTTNNVVTYTVVIGAPNPENILKPGMTANATFFVTERRDILLIPAKATRFTPDPELLAQVMPMGGPQGATKGDQPKPAMGGGMPEGGPMHMGMEKSENDSVKMVWIKGANGIHPHRITVGVTDEINYEVVKGLSEGEEVVTGITVSGGAVGTATKAARSPFMPQRPGANKRSSTSNTTQGPPPR